MLSDQSRFVAALCALVGLSAFLIHSLGGFETSPSSAYSVARSKTNGSEAQDLRELQAAMNGFRKGLVERDSLMIRNYSAPGLSFGHPNGSVESRQELVESLQLGREVFENIKLRHRTTQIIGIQAVERHHLSADVTSKGHTRHVEVDVLEIWQKTDHWRLWIHQAYNDTDNHQH
ncbi:MAG: nuclear transport factor 2 family protein [Pseudomonadota bacterium]